MIKKIVFCLILLCCISPIAFAETPSDNITDIGDLNEINKNIENIQSGHVYDPQKNYFANNSTNNNVSNETLNNNNSNESFNNFTYKINDVASYINPIVRLIGTNTYFPSPNTNSSYTPHVENPSDRWFTTFNHPFTKDNELYIPSLAIRDLYAVPRIPINLINIVKKIFS